MNRTVMGALLAAAGVAIGMLLSAPATVANEAKTPAASASGQGGVATKTEAAKDATQDKKPETRQDSGSSEVKEQEAPEKHRHKACEPAPCAAGPCPCPTSNSDIAIAALFVIAILGAVVAVGRLARPAVEDGQELTDLRELVKNQLLREQDQNQAARAWGLQAFETLARTSRFAEPSAPAVLDVQPPTGPAQHLVHILGRGFEPGSQVLVAGVPATEVIFVSPFELTAKVPMGTAGTRATVTVVWPAGRSAYLESAFAYT